ncbi:MAG: cysteine--tRNA ligase, partial [Planctomycetes bacterium]|nr:cysteine--tRNA ligase [Planctomycetota bacterium]
MDDDFNTAAAVGVPHEMLSALNRFVDKHQLETAAKGDARLQGALRRGAVVLKEGASVLGLFRKPPEEPPRGGDELTAKLLNLLVELRAQARGAKNFALADQIRSRLAQLGVTLEDRPEGTAWRIG